MGSEQSSRKRTVPPPQVCCTLVKARARILSACSTAKSAALSTTVVSMNRSGNLYNVGPVTLSILDFAFPKVARASPSWRFLLDFVPPQPQ